MNSQTKQIIQLFKDNPNRELSALELHRVGSGKEHGFCASLSRRISDCRESGMTITCRVEEVEGQRHSYYTYDARQRDKLGRVIEDAGTGQDSLLER